MNPAPLSRDGLSSEEIRKRYPLWPRAVGIFNEVPIGVKANYDRMEVIDINGDIIFRLETDNTLLMQIRFIHPCYLLIVEGAYIFPSRLRVFNLDKNTWQFDDLPLDSSDMMEPYLDAHPHKPIIAIYTNDGVQLIDIRLGKILQIIEGAEMATFFRSDDLIHCDYKGVITLQADGKKQTIFNTSSLNQYGTDISAIAPLNHSNEIIISPLDGHLLRYNLDTTQLRTSIKPGDEVQHIEITPDDCYAKIALYQGESYLLELATNKKITLEDCIHLDISAWAEGYVVSMGKQGLRTVELDLIL